MAFLPGLFGGKNQVGFFGGGQRVSDPNSYKLPGMQDMQDENWKMGMDRAHEGDAAYQQQQQLMGNLFNTLNGTQPSVAQQMLNQNTQGNIAQAHALAASNPGNAGNARMVAQNVGALNQQATGQGALLRAQEMASTQGLIGNMTSNMYGQANQLGANYLGQNQQMAETQLDANIKREQQEAANFSGAQQNAVGGKLLNAAASIGGAMATGGASAIGPAIGKVASAVASKAHGGLIPGYAPGGAVDNTRSDVVPAMLSPKEIVLPRSVTLAPDAPEKAAAFVEAIRRKHGLKRAA